MRLSGSVGPHGLNAPEDVRRVQDRLVERGHLDRATGYIGTKTVAGTKTFQRDQGLAQDGRIDPGGLTERALASDVAKTAAKLQATRFELGRKGLTKAEQVNAVTAHQKAQKEHAKAVAQANAEAPKAAEKTSQTRARKPAPPPRKPRVPDIFAKPDTGRDLREARRDFREIDAVVTARAGQAPHRNLLDARYGEMENRVNAGKARDRAILKAYMAEARRMKDAGRTIDADTRKAAWAKAVRSHDDAGHSSPARQAPLLTQALDISGNAWQGTINHMAHTAQIPPELVNAAGKTGLIALAAVIAERRVPDTDRHVYQTRLANVLGNLQADGHGDLLRELTRFRGEANVSPSWNPVTMSDEEIREDIWSSELMSKVYGELSGVSPDGSNAKRKLLGKGSSAFFEYLAKIYQDHIDKLDHELRRRRLGGS